MDIDLMLEGETRQALMELIARYAFAADEGDPTAFADCFTPEGILRTNRPIELTGEAELRAFARQLHAEDQNPTRHVTWHHVFTKVSDDEVTGRCAAGLVKTTASGPAWIFVGTYQDRFVLGRGSWRLALRDVRMDRATAAG